MEETSSGPVAIPPGVVPSESKEDLYKELCSEGEDTKSQTILTDEERISSPEPTPVASLEQTLQARSDTPTSAWPERDKEDLVEGNHDQPIPGMFSSDLLKEALTHHDRKQEQPSATKRPNSPLRKKFNKVAPLDVPDGGPTASKPSALTTAAVTLGHYENTTTVITNSGALTENIITSQDNNSSTTVVLEPLYSTVVKVKPIHYQYDSSRGQSGEGMTSGGETHTPSDQNQHNILERSSPDSAVDSAIDFTTAVKHQDNSSTEETNTFPLSEEPEAQNMKVSKKSAATTEKRIQLLSVKPLSEMEVVTHAQSFPAGSSSDMHPLHYLSSTGDKKKLAESISLIRDGQESTRDAIDIKDSEGRTPLMHAIHNEHLGCVKILLEADADINAISKDGSTPLHHVCYTGSYDMLALLLSLGADGSIQDTNGRYPLHWVTNNDDVKCTQLLLDKVPGINVNTRDATMMTPLMWAAFHARPEHIKLLKQNGADTSLVDVDGMFAIHWAIHRHETGTLRELIDVNATKYQDNMGRTVMHVAAVEGCAKEVNLIRSIRPTSVQDLDKEGRTPLHWAAACDNPDVIKALLAAEANPNIKDSTDRTPMDYAVEKQLHYCTLLLSKSLGGPIGPDQACVFAQSFANGTGDQHQLMESVSNDAEAILARQATLLKNLSVGCWMHKFTDNGKGPIHLRFFTVLLAKQKLCWAKSAEAADKDIKSDRLLNVRSSVSPLVQGRRDFDPVFKHRYAFTILTTHRVINVVAVSSEDYKIWINGLQLLLEIGSDQAVQIATQV